MDITITVEGAADVQRRLEAAGANTPLIIARALNDAIQSVKTATVRALAEETEITQKDIRPGTTLVRAKRTNLAAGLRVTGHRIPLLAFKARQTRKGVTYKLKHGRGFVPSAFLAEMRSGHRGVFKRKGAARLPIQELFGPSLPGVVIRQRIYEAQEELGRDLFRKRLEHELLFLLQQGFLLQRGTTPAGEENETNDEAESSGA